MTRHVIIAAPGRYEAPEGGIVQQMRSLVEHAHEHDTTIRFHWLRTHNHTRLWPCYFIISLLRCVWLVLRYRPVYVLLNLASGGSFVRKYSLFCMARMLGANCITYLHGGGFGDFYHQSRPWVRRHIRRLFTGSAQMITLGQAGKDFACSLGCAPDRVHIVRNAVPEPSIARTHNATPHIIFAGHVVERKGVGELIEALARLRSHAWRATIAGSGDDATYQALAESHGLCERIHFAGWLSPDAMQALYASGDIMVLPSYIENQPLCLLEAMSHGLAIIATHVGTIPECLRDGQDALLIPPRDTDALARALAEMLASADLVKMLSKSARLRFETYHQMNSYCAALKKIILLQKSSEN